jgi:hypothetical protein
VRGNFAQARQLKMRQWQLTRGTVASSSFALGAELGQAHASTLSPWWRIVFKQIRRSLRPQPELIPEFAFTSVGRTIGLSTPVSAKRQTDKSEHRRDGSGYHQPVRIFHR